MIRSMASDINGNVVWIEIKPSEQNKYKRLKELEQKRILKEYKINDRTKQKI
jgi:hypothetical protein